MKKNVQHFSSERLAMDRAMSKEEIVQFLDEFQKMVSGDEGKRKLISLRVPENLLSLFRAKAQKEGVSYQTKIVDLMRSWIKD